MTDVLALAEYANSYRAAAGDALVDDLFDCFEDLVTFPHLGRARPELGASLRSFVLAKRRIIVFYMAQPDARDRVLIVRVLRQERDVSSGDFD